MRRGGAAEQSILYRRGCDVDLERVAWGGEGIRHGGAAKRLRLVGRVKEQNAWPGLRRWMLWVGRAYGAEVQHKTELQAKRCGAINESA
eukprot:1152872-Pelagomonas_calceolata.AAC.7